jgi:hypothetical protein
MDNIFTTFQNRNEKILTDEVPRQKREPSHNKTQALEHVAD